MQSYHTYFIDYNTEKFLLEWHTERPVPGATVRLGNRNLWFTVKTVTELPGNSLIVRLQRQLPKQLPRTFQKLSTKYGESTHDVEPY